MGYVMLDTTMKVVRIDENTLDAIKDSDSLDNTKVINLINKARSMF